LKNLDFAHMEGLFLIDLEGTITSANSFVQQLFEFDKTQLVGKNIASILPNLEDLSEDQNDGAKRQKISNTEWISSSGSTYLKLDSGKEIPVSWKIVDMNDQKVVRVKMTLLPPPHALYAHKRKEKKIVGNYIIENIIGSGNFGKVKRAVHLLTQQEAAVKILSKRKMECLDMERSKREGSILQKLNHPNIVKFLQSEETEKHLYFFLELVGGTDLKTHIIQTKPSKDELRTIFKQLASAIAFCHQLNIIHRDLKQSNILIDKQNQLKLIDFGLSNYSEEGKLRSTFCGSPAYAAPEMLLGTKYSGPEPDIWSLGVVLYSMVTSKLPFESVGQLIKCHYTIPEGLDPDLVDLIRSMLEFQPTKRISIQDVLSHPWVTRIVAEENSDAN